MSTTAADPILATPKTASDRADRRRLILHCLFFAALAYCAHFWRSGQFGLYEDDLVIFPTAVTANFSTVLAWIKSHFATFEQGRPVGFSIWLILPYLGFKFGNLHAVYTLCSLVVCANVVLFYLLLRRGFGQAIAVLGALAYCLFPADTSRALLVHTTILQPAVLFFLIGAHCYLSKRYVPAYVMGLAVLLSYESPFLPFLFIPLFRPSLDRAAVRRFVVHIAICAGLVLAVASVRLAFGEERVLQASSTSHSVLYRVLTNVYLGPTTAAKVLYTDPRVTFNKLADPEIAIPTIVGFFACAALLLTCTSLRKSAARADQPTPTYPLLVGLAMFLTSYTLAISPDHYPPTATFGRMTSVHLAATIGGSLALAALLQLLLRLADRARLRVPALVLLSGYFAGLIGFAFVVQQGFVLAHKAQRTFWTQVVQLCPDLQDGTVILLEGRFPTASRYILNTSWSDPLVLPSLLQFPPTFRHPPILIRIPTDDSWTSALKPDGGTLVWSRLFNLGTRPYPGEPLVDGKTILLRPHGQTLERVSTTLTIQGHPFHFTPARPALITPAFPPSPLYPLFVKDLSIPAGPILKLPPNSIPSSP